MAKLTPASESPSGEGTRGRMHKTLPLCGSKWPFATITKGALSCYSGTGDELFKYRSATLLTKGTVLASVVGC